MQAWNAAHTADPTNQRHHGFGPRVGNYDTWDRVGEAGDIVTTYQLHAGKGTMENEMIELVRRELPGDAVMTTNGVQRLDDATGGRCAFVNFTSPTLAQAFAKTPDSAGNVGVLLYTAADRGDPQPIYDYRPDNVNLAALSQQPLGPTNSC